jgi:outer membrane lipoprotein-sorting protein
MLTMTLTGWSRSYLLIALGCALIGCARTALTVDQVIERNTQAAGGRSAIEAVQSIEVDLHIVDPGFEVDGKYRAARPGRMRIDVMAGGKHVYTEAFDGQRGWQWKGQGTTIEQESPKATAALRHGVELPGKLFGLHELYQRGHRVDLAGRETIDGIDYYALRVTLNDGFMTTLYVDPRNWLITRRRDVRPLHVDVDPTPTTIESRFSDFRKVDGVLFPFASTDTDIATGKVLETTHVRSIKVNPKFNPATFSTL